ncbi:MAG: hypothetical protein ABIJ95_07915 [Pseudomonadota bacterium]
MENAGAVKGKAGRRQDAAALSEFVALMEARAMELAEAAEAARIRGRDLHVLKFEGQEVSRELATARENLNALELETEAAVEVLETKRALLVEALPADIEKRIQSMGGQFSALELERDAAQKRFLDAVAKAVCLKSLIHGGDMMQTGNGDWVPGSIGLEVKPAYLADEDRRYLQAAVEKTAGGSLPGRVGCLKDRLNGLSRQMDELKRMTATPALLQEEAARMVKAARPVPEQAAA